MKVLVVFYAMYGHVYKVAEAVAEGAREVEGTEVILKRVPETIPEEVLISSGAKEAQKAFEHLKVCTLDDPEEADAIIFGTPVRFGNMAGQMRQFLDTTGGLWFKGAFTGKVGSVFASANNQHGGQEPTILSFHTNLLHFGMVIVGLPYAFEGQVGVDEVLGGSPYGAFTIAGPTGQRMPSEVELEGAKYQGRHVATIASKLSN
ncbi:MAG: NAD(P)H:quinone oxidoreductase [Candidatus Kariarchaeaceae archaeon]